MRETQVMVEEEEKVEVNQKGKVTENKTSAEFTVVTEVEKEVEKAVLNGKLTKTSFGSIYKDQGTRLTQDFSS